MVVVADGILLQLAQRVYIEDSHTALMNVVYSHVVAQLLIEIAIVNLCCKEVGNK